jgi:hypothetical protein
VKLFTCTCEWVFVVGRKRVFGPMFPGPGEHNAYWHVGRMMTREQFADEYADCAYRFSKGIGSLS